MSSQNPHSQIPTTKKVTAVYVWNVYVWNLFKPLSWFQNRIVLVVSIQKKFYFWKSIKNWWDRRSLKFENRWQTNFSGDLHLVYIILWVYCHKVIFREKMLPMSSLKPCSKTGCYPIVIQIDLSELSNL